MKPEIEDGMGFSGLVLTMAEKEQERRDQAERKRIKGMEARIRELEEANAILASEVNRLNTIMCASQGSAPSDEGKP